MCRACLTTWRCKSSTQADGDWHHVALTWDGTNKVLWVDSMEVARDIQTGLMGSNRGLSIGTDYIEATFFSGLMDDVRIYDVSLSADEIAALVQ